MESIPHVSSSGDILSLADPSSDPSLAERVGRVLPRFSRQNKSSNCTLEAQGRVVRYAAGGKAPALAEIDVDGGRCELEVLDCGFAASRRPERSLRGAAGQLPHCFGGGCLLRESGDWIAGGRAVASTGESYETFRDGDVVVLTIRGSELDQACGPRDGGALRPYVFLRGLEGAAAALRPRGALAPRRRAAYPAAFHGAALALDEAATAKVGFSFPAELLEAVLAFNDWCDFY
ncbi:ATP binding protein [Aureococcus anophagefferens]|nr:ATP binding protein [Aureococcus anophagefferens]